ncbi:MAG: hypothetical protein HYZ65_11775 [Burkholderiales bacterium]|nr:hypothetical protein [Burkholderiales bacterium]
MKNFSAKSKCVLLMLGTIFLTACNNQNSTAQTPEQAEAIRQLAGSMDETAGNLVIINPKHDKQYYKDKLLEITKECIPAADTAECFRSRAEVLKTI